jgi:1-acyl-sn-glycerol-3-phosphate acyltransferase
MMQALSVPSRRSAADRIRLAPSDDAVVWPPQHRSFRKLRAIRRIALVLLFVPPGCLIQAVLLLCAPVGKVKFAVFFWKTIGQMIGLQVRVIGTPARIEGEGRRPVIYACNHSSWLDIPALGGLLRACFVSKDDVAGWPVIGTIARLGRSVFVSRARQNIGRERDDMQARLRGGDDLILFPEGTSSDGSRVLPFHSSFFAAAYGEASPLIQPVSVVYDRLENLPVGRSSRTAFAWFGDMSLAPHVWQVVQWQGKRVTLLFHPPLDPANFASRKALSQAAWEAVADGAATLRQNRAPKPCCVAVPAAGTTQAFA